MIFYQTGRLSIFRYSIIWLLFSVPALAEDADFWIIENPAVLYIYNQYEQRLDINEKSVFSRYSAWQIISRSQLLSDQYTRVARTRYDQATYYLQLTDDGKLVNHEEAGRIEIIKNARLLGDTIRVKHSGALKLESGPNRHNLPEGTLLHRLFQLRNKIFVRELGGFLNGWLNRSRQEDFEIFHVDKKAAAYEEKLFGQVNRIFQSYNRHLNQLFDRLNQRYNKSLPPPIWERNAASPFLSYTLHPASYQGRFPATRSNLVQELNDLLHGSDYTVVLDQENIMIKNTTP